MKIILIAILISFTLFSCVTYNACINKFGEKLVKTDTLYKTKIDTLKTVKYHYDTITLAGDQIIIVDTIISPYKINQKASGVSKSGRTKVNVDITNNVLTVDCRTDSLIRIIESKDSLITILKNDVITINNQSVINKASWWSGIPWWVKVISILFLLILLILMLKKIFKF